MSENNHGKLHLPPDLWSRDLTPIAVVIIDGLAICRFTGKLWEILFFHESHHNFTLSNKDIGDVKLDDTADELRIYAKGSSPYQEFPKGFYTDGPKFQRLNSSNSPHDFRWVIDVASDKDMPPGRVSFRRPANYFTTKVSIENAVMFTGKLTEQTLFRVPDGIDPNRNSSEMEELGKANDTIVAVVFGNDSQISMEVLRSGRSSDQHRLPVSAAPHQIDLMNMRHLHLTGHEHDMKSTHTGTDAVPNRWVEGDFKLYYGAVTADKQWSLWGEPSKLLGDWIDCDSITLSGES